MYAMYVCTLFLSARWLIGLAGWEDRYSDGGLYSSSTALESSETNDQRGKKKK